MAQFSPKTSTTLACVAMLASTPFAMGQTESTSGGTNPGVWGIPGPIFRDLVSHPNATGSIDFSPSNNTQYKLQLNITADVPLTNAADWAVEDGKSSYSTTSIFSLTADSEASISNTRICYSVWSGLAANISAASKGRSSQDGLGCGDMLSEECISDLMSEGGQYARYCQPAPALPDSCLSQLPDDVTGVASTFEYNASDPVFFMHAAARTSDQGNQTVWAAESTNIFPVLLAFFPNKTGEHTVELSCIKADTFSEGTVNPNNETTTGTSTGETPTGTATSQPTSSPSSGTTVMDRFPVTASLSIILAVAVGFF